MQGELSAWLESSAGSDEEFVDRVWRLALRRAPEPEAREQALRQLHEGTLSRSALLRDLVGSDEFARVELLDRVVAFAAGERRRPRTARGPWRPRELRAPAWSDERAVEIPWCLARYDGEQQVLDVGYAFAEPAYLAGLTALGAAALTGVDLRQADVPGLRPVVADVRSLPLPSHSVDLAFCISTLEHVGRDNAAYAVDAPQAADGDEAALLELHRVLSRDGRLLVSVPAGEPEDQGWQVVRRPAEWVALFERAGYLVYEDELYVHGVDGWRPGFPNEAAAARYGEHGPGAGAVLLAELRPRGLGERVRLAARDVRHRELRRSTLI